MKKYLSLFIIVFTFTISNAQITITNIAGTPILDGDIITFNTTDEHSNLVTLITNNSGSSIDLSLVCDPITGTTGSDMEFCIGSCYWGITEGTVYPLSGSDAYTIGAGETSGALDVHFHNHDSGNPIITYDFKIYEDGNESNAISFTYKYDVNYVVNVDNITNSSISLYPNPATDNFTITVSDDFIGSQIILTNLLGKIVLKQNISSSKQNFAINNLGSGIYFYSIVNNNKIVATKKLIIK